MKDIDIRNIIKDSFFKKYYDDPNSRVVEEMNVCLGEARIDIAVINGSLHGYEIKSERDTLNRLPNQLEMYSKIFDYLTIVCGESHLEDVMQKVPHWCGIIVASSKKSSDGYKLKKIRVPIKNDFIDKYSIAQLLWKEEVLICLNNIGINKGLSGKNKFQLWEILSQSIPAKELAHMVREIMKLRPQWRLELQPSENDGYTQLSSKL
jgi:hypothetical protein